MNLILKNLIFHLWQRRQLIEFGRPTLIFSQRRDLAADKFFREPAFKVADFSPEIERAYANAGITATRYLDDGRIQFLAV
jgi:hypothetical protein